MDVIKGLQRRLPFSNQRVVKGFPTTSEKLKPRRLSFLQRKIRIRGGSNLSVPLYVVLLLPLALLVILLLIFVRPSSGGGGLMSTGGSSGVRKINERYDKVFVTGCLDPKVSAAENKRANAAFVVLARNKELDGVIESLKSVERHFNRWFHYPYVFLNDGEFNSTFKETVSRYISGTVEFGRIGPEHWGYPDWVDKNVAQEGIRKQGDQAIMYGGMESYHHMCRFYSGFFYKHELLQKYEWYWRVEPEIKYFCDITYDPFLYMEKQNKTYGFTIAVKELKETVPNIFRYASAFKRARNMTSKGLWEFFVLPKEGYKQDGTRKEDASTQDDADKKKKEDAAVEPGRTNLPDIDPDSMEGESYNMCHFWSNFEIARLDFFRSKEYEEFFQMMDRSGGFWMERWGDAPIHSLGAGALLAPSQVHYFRDIGYRHTTIQHCPANAPSRQLPRDPWLEKTTLDERARREEDEYWAKWDTEQENGVGCRCRCDTDVEEVEGKEGSCIPEWVEIAGGFITPEGPN